MWIFRGRMLEEGIASAKALSGALICTWYGEGNVWLQHNEEWEKTKAGRCQED